MSDPKYEKVGSPIINLIEECAELIHLLCKAERFGLGNWHPSDKKQRMNHELILDEMEDVEKRIRDYCDEYGYRHGEVKTKNFNDMKPGE